MSNILNDFLTHRCCVLQTFPMRDQQKFFSSSSPAQTTGGKVIILEAFKQTNLLKTY